jgi:hypothetical protein
MTESTLKTILVLEPKTQRYKPVAHNLNASDAADAMTEYSSKGKTAKAIDQPHTHRAANARKCKPCREAALREPRDAANHAPGSDMPPS